MEERDLSSELSDSNRNRAKRTQSGSLVNSGRSHILESVGSDASGSEPGGDLPTGACYEDKKGDGTSHSEHSDIPNESATSDWPWS